MQKFLVLCCLFILTQCSDGNRDPKTLAMTSDQRYQQKNTDLLFGDPLIDTSSSKKDDGQPYPVNVYLWRASLDTLSFMPLKTVEPLGGVITTDWYSPADASDERLKVNVVISGTKLRADALKVSLFHQIQNAQKEWAPADVSEETREELEQVILTRARQLKIEATTMK